jgi:uncharacterized protein YbaR (Trm112 family)
MNADILHKLICPNCSSPRLSNKALSVIESNCKDAVTKPLECNACRSVYPCHDGIIDLSGSTITVPRKFSSQWAMEFQPLVAFYEHIWRPTVTKPFSDLNWEIDTVQKLLETAYGLDVLDLGCGPGNFTRLIAQTVKPGVVIGFDLSLPMHRADARRCNPLAVCKGKFRPYSLLRSATPLSQASSSLCVDSS